MYICRHFYQTAILHFREVGTTSPDNFVSKPVTKGILHFVFPRHIGFNVKNIVRFKIDPSDLA